MSAVDRRHASPATIAHGASCRMRPIQKRGLVIGVAFVIGVLLVNAGVAFRQAARMHEDSFWVAHTHEVLASLTDLLSSVKDAETGVRGFLITGEPRYLEPYKTCPPCDRRFDRAVRHADGRQPDPAGASPPLEGAGGGGNGRSEAGRRCSKPEAPRRGRQDRGTGPRQTDHGFDPHARGPDAGARTRAARRCAKE